ncbi:hypothetical protein DRH13_06435 [Candidatus Woesebacteria bacterium]|nr:MAG: hypothetical protein DRH13_06435 [Candidatus Woesebacteria bacterium]
MKATVNEKGREKYIWLIFATMSIIIILSSVFFLAFPEITFDISMEYPGSSLTWESLDEGSKVGMYFLIARPFWDEILFGIFGLYCAWGLKKRESYAWNLSMVWGVMVLSAGIALGLSEIIIGKWLSVCVVTYLYCISGVIALSCLFTMKKESN